MICREFPGTPVVGTRRLHCEAPGLIPGWGGGLCRAENENNEEEEGIGYKKNFLSFELVEFDGLFCFIFVILLTSLWYEYFPQKIKH